MLNMSNIAERGLVVSCAGVDVLRYVASNLHLALMLTGRSVTKHDLFVSVGGIPTATGTTHRIEWY